MSTLRKSDQKIRWAESGATDGRADLAELAGRALAEESHGDDADNGDECHEEGVLHEGCTTVALATSLHPSADEFI